MNKNAQALGQLGGQARAKALKKAERVRIARLGGLAIAGKPRKARK